MSLELLRKKIHEFIVKNYDLVQHKPEILEEFKKNLLFKVKELDFGEDMDYQDYNDDEDQGEDFENMEGFQVVDGDEDMDNDAAAQFLREAEAKQSGQEDDQDVDYEDVPEADELEEEGLESEDKPRFGSRWKSNEGAYSEEHKAKIKEIMDQGYSQREAERFVNAHTGPNSFEDALNSKMDVPDMSEAFLARLKPLAHNYITTHNERRIKDADASKNRELAVRGKMLEDFQSRNKDWNQAWKEHKQTDEYKNLSAAERLTAKKKFRDAFLESNPEHFESFKNIDTATHRKSAAKSFQDAANDQLAALLTNNVGDAMSAQEAGQAIGAPKTEGGGYQMNTKGALGNFAANNRKFLENRAAKVVMDKYGGKLSDDQIDRLKRITGVKAGTIKPEGDGGENA